MQQQDDGSSHIHHFHPHKMTMLLMIELAVGLVLGGAFKGGD